MSLALTLALEVEFLTLDIKSLITRLVKMRALDATQVEFSLTRK